MHREHCSPRVQLQAQLALLPRAAHRRLRPEAVDAAASSPPADQWQQRQTARQQQHENIWRIAGNAPEPAQDDGLLALGPGSSSAGVPRYRCRIRRRLHSVGRPDAATAVSSNPAVVRKFLRWTSSTTLSQPNLLEKLRFNVRFRPIAAGHSIPKADVQILRETVIWTSSYSGNSILRCSLKAGNSSLSPIVLRWIRKMRGNFLNHPDIFNFS